MSDSTDMEKEPSVQPDKLSTVDSSDVGSNTKATCYPGEMGQGTTLTAMSKHWKRLQALKERRQEVCKKTKSTEKRIAMAKIKDPVIQNAKDAFGDDLDKSGSHKTQTKSFPSTSHQANDVDTDNSLTDEKLSKEQTNAGNEVEWEKVRGCMGINDHLKGIEYTAKSKLEKDIDAALKAGNYEMAEKLSDRISANKFGKSVTDAFDAKRFLEKRKKEEEAALAKKKKKLHWGFDHKQRWETKGNM